MHTLFWFLLTVYAAVVSCLLGQLAMSFLYIEGQNMILLTMLVFAVIGSMIFITCSCVLLYCIIYRIRNGRSYFADDPDRQS